MSFDFIRAALPVAAVFTLAASAADALPQFRNLFESRAGYRASCLVCHQPRDWRPTPYAREYVRLNGGAAAIEALDFMDPDADGVASKVEISNRANPGDPRSTPEHVGDWLANPMPAVPPKEFIDLWGTTVTVRALERPLSREERTRVELALSQVLRDEEASTVVFAASDLSRKVLGYGLYAFQGTRRLTVLFAAMGTDFKLRAVFPIKVYGDQRFGKPDYLRQFAGRGENDLLGVAAPRGSESQNAEVLAAVRRAMKVAEVAVSGR